MQIHWLNVDERIKFKMVLLADVSGSGAKIFVDIFGHLFAMLFTSVICRSMDNVCPQNKDGDS